jgi:hypothetical protein
MVHHLQEAGAVADDGHVPQSPVTPTVSCVIATHNFAPYLGRAIESVLEQDYPEHALEVIVVDDGSTDDTPAVVARYGDRVRYIRKRNGGHLSTYDRGLRESTGDYVALLDGDDEWFAHKTREQVAMFAADPRLSLVHGDLVLVDSDGEPFAMSFFAESGLDVVEGDLLGMLLQRNVVSTTTLMVTRAVRDHAVPIPNWGRAQDWWLALSAAQLGRIGCTPAALSTYRRHETNMNLGRPRATRVRLTKRELPLRRWLLHCDAAQQVGGADLISALVVYDHTLTTVARALGQPPNGVVTVSAQQRRRAQMLRSQAASARRAGDVHGAARALVAAAALDPADRRAHDAALALAAEVGWGPLAPTPRNRRAAEVEDARGFAVLADAEELVRDPALLTAYARSFSGRDDATLVIRAPSEEALGALSQAVAEVGGDRDDGPDLLAVPTHTLSDADAAQRVDCVLTAVLPDGPLAGLPAIAPDGTAVLRGYAQRLSGGEHDALTFCVTICAPSWAGAAAWGDLHFARAIQQELHRAGHPCAIEVMDEWTQARRERFDVVVHLRGLQPHAAAHAQLGILWSISHPDLVTAAECDASDLVLVASEPFAAQLAPRTRTAVEVLEQATDPAVFFPDPHPAVAHELIFVGNSRRVRRPIIDDLLPTQHDLAIWGADWEPLIGDRHLAGTWLPSDDVRRVYSSAAIVLNDHWEDMRRHGYASNRLYDAVACGALVLSDRVAGLDDRFGGAVVTYETREELHELVEHFLAAPQERAERAAAGRERVLAAHTFAHRVDRLLDLAHGALSREREQRGQALVAY